MPATRSTTPDATPRSVPDGADPAVDGELAADLRLAVMRLARRLRQQGHGEATPSMLSALSTLEQAGPMTLGELAAIERITPPSLTRILGRLEEEGLVERHVHRDDRRVSLVSAAAAGRNLLERNRSRKDAYLAARIRELTGEDRGRLRAALPVLEGLVERP